MFDQISLESISLWTYLIVFSVGVLVCFTPCVYPIMPVLLGYLGGTPEDAAGRKAGFFRALAYVLGLCAVYSVLGAVAALSGGIFGLLQGSFWVNLIAANIFIIMGLFMLEVFTWPQVSVFRNASLPGRKSRFGAFLMGAISGLVVGPCTTPVLGGILAYVASQKNVAVGISLLLTYSLGMGFPLLVLGGFVGLLKKMPKSGVWMQKIKKICGLLLIASGEYFLLQI